VRAHYIQRAAFDRYTAARTSHEYTPYTREEGGQEATELETITEHLVHKEADTDNYLSYGRKINETEFREIRALTRTRSRVYIHGGISHITRSDVYLYFKLPSIHCFLQEKQASWTDIIVVLIVFVNDF
jgi:hypothetical protein